MKPQHFTAVAHTATHKHNTKKSYSRFSPLYDTRYYIFYPNFYLTFRSTRYSHMTYLRITATILDDLAYLERFAQWVNNWNIGINSRKCWVVYDLRPAATILPLGVSPDLILRTLQENVMPIIAHPLKLKKLTKKIYTHILKLKNLTKKISAYHWL